MARLSKIYFGLLACGFALATVTAAHAFTFDNSTSTNSDGSAKYSDPDQKYDRPANRGGSTFQFGNGATMSVGRQRSFDAEFNEGKQRMLSPIDRDR